MSKLYRCCEGLREPDWSRYTRLEVSGSKDHDGETEAMVYATDAEFFTVYGRLPSFEVEPVTDCYDAVTLLAVAAELGFRSKLDVLLHPTLFDTPPVASDPGQRVPATAHTDDGAVVVQFDATPFFESVNDDLIRDLIDDGFAGGYGADAVAQELAEEGNDLGRMFWYLGNTNQRSHEAVGYEVAVDAEAAKSWLRAHKPYLLEREAPQREEK